MKTLITMLAFIGATFNLAYGEVDNLGRKSLPKTVQPSSQSDEIFEFVFLGNSLTKHVPMANIGWTGNYGMAASKVENDYVHKFLSLVEGSSPYIANMYPIEKDISELNVVMNRVRPAIQNANTVIIQLGDNTNHTKDEELAALKVSIEEIASLTAPSQILLCVSTYWRNAVKDRVIRESCERSGGKYVFIGDIHEYQNNDELPYFNHSGVNVHPKDKQMRFIAQRLYAARVEKVGY